MSVARQYSQPRSIVLGRPVPKPGTPLWLPEDFDWAAAYEQYLASLCGNCSTRRETWEDDPEAYVARPDRCPGCYKLAVGDAEIPEAERGQAARSVLVPTDTFEMRLEIKDAADRLNLPLRPRSEG